MIHLEIEEALDQIDAAVFSGNTFHNAHDRKKLRDFCTRWLKEADRIAEIKWDDTYNPMNYD